MAFRKKSRTAALKKAGKKAQKQLSAVVKRATTAAQKAARRVAKKVAKRRAAAAPKPRARTQPENLRVRSLSVGMTVGDIDRSIKWYRDVLGCVVEDTWTSEGKLMGATMRSGNARFSLGQDDWKMGRDRVKGVGIRLYCTSVQDVDRLAAAIKARGVALAHDPVDQPWGVRDFGLSDPDGFRITIQAVTGS